jgi:Protein of unknown function (DUF541)
MKWFRVGKWLVLGIGMMSSWQPYTMGASRRAIPYDSDFRVNNDQIALKPQHPPRIAQLFYPPADQKPVLRVIGKGRAAQPADTAELIFEFSVPETPPTAEDSSTEETTPYHRKKHQNRPKHYKAPVDEPDTQKLKPIMDALKKLGVSEQDMTVKPRKSKGASPFPFPFPSKVTTSGLDLSVKQAKPTQSSLHKLVATVETTAQTLDSLSLNRTGVIYTVDNCQNLEAQVYRSAGEDALNRATAIASAMGAKLSPVPSVAQPIYDLIYPACRSGRPFPFNEDDADFDRDSVPEVILTREIFVTFTLKRK